MPRKFAGVTPGDTLPANQGGGFSSSENARRDRSRAAVAADDQGHIHRLLGPGQVGVHRLRVDRVSQRARPFDQRLQPRAVDDPVESEKPALVLFLVLVLVLFERAGGIVMVKVPTWSLTGTR